MKRVFLKISVAYISMLIFFVVSMWGIHCIPRDFIRENVKESAYILQREGLYKKFFNFGLFQLDNYTDALMMSIAVATDDVRPLYSSMANCVILEQGDPIEAALYGAEHESDGFEKGIYARYWHGYQLFLRPLLCITNINGIRVINYVLLFLLAFICLRLLWYNVSKESAVILGLLMIVINFPMIPYSMQFSTCFYLMFISTIVLLAVHGISRDYSNLLTMFFVVGGATSFFDFLTTPLLALGIPLTVYILKMHPQEKVRCIFNLCFLWGLGYGLIWVSKWMIGSVMIGENIVGNAINQFLFRTSTSSLEGEVITMDSFVGLVQACVARHGLQNIISIQHMVCLIGICFALAFFVYYNKQKGFEVQKEYWWLLLVASIVPVWLVILLNHTYYHYWFTWRALLVTMYASSLWIYYTTRTLKRRY